MRIKSNSVQSSRKIKHVAAYGAMYPYFIDNKIHVCYEGKYYTYSKPTFMEHSGVIKLNEINKFDTNEYSPKFCAEHSLQLANVNYDCDKLLLFGGYYSDGDDFECFDDIQSYDIDPESEEKEPKDWKKLDVKLPYAKIETPYLAVVGFNTILFYFNKKEMDIFCLDLLITNKWYKSHKQFPKEIKSAGFIVITKDNYAHVMGVGRRIHAIFALYDVVPTELINIYQTNSESLIIGYIRLYIEQKYQVSIPNALKYLICQLYPSLL